jgi:hypothetical protein
MEANQNATTTPTVNTTGVVTQTASYLPLALIDKCIGSRLWVIMKDEKELVSFFFYIKSKFYFKNRQVFFADLMIMLIWFSMMYLNIHSQKQEKKSLSKLTPFY